MNPRSTGDLLRAPLPYLQARVRTRLARALRSRVAGEEADANAAQIWGRTGKRWFTEDDVIWRVHADASMFVGGIRALLLQSLHPLAMAGVAGHSGYRGDPWGRLQRTSTFLATTTFGTIDDASAAIGRVRDIHERVRGRADDGRPYRASDPHLLKWVHVAEADSFLTAFQEFGPGPLSPAECDDYVAQSARTANLLGVIDAPTTYAELRRTLADFASELHGTAAARDAARFLLLTPPLPAAARPGYAMLAAGAVATLPLDARRELGIPAPANLSAWGDRLAGRPLGRGSAALVRWALSDPAISAERRARTPE